MRIVAWDLETTDLKALMGRILCCSFYTIGHNDPKQVGKIKTFRIDHKPWRTDDPIDDSRLAVAIRDELEKYHCIVGWNSKMFDLPLLNARLLKAGEREVRHQLHMDPMYYAGGVSLRIGSRKLVNVEKFFSISDGKTDISWEMWQRAAMGDKKAMKYVVEHCEKDVDVLAQVYWKILPMIRNIHR
jgi:uncharacterized protein YprB with RNaseH-like and TPR domain